MDFSRIEIHLLTEDLRLVEKTFCSENGFFLLPISERRRYIIKVFSQDNLIFGKQFIANSSIFSYFYHFFLIFFLFFSFYHLFHMFFTCFYQIFKTLSQESWIYRINLKRKSKESQNKEIPLNSSVFQSKARSIPIIQRTLPVQKVLN